MSGPPCWIKLKLHLFSFVADCCGFVAQIERVEFELNCNALPGNRLNCNHLSEKLLVPDTEQTENKYIYVYTDMRLRVCAQRGTVETLATCPSRRRVQTACSARWWAVSVNVVLVRWPPIDCSVYAIVRNWSAAAALHISIRAINEPVSAIVNSLISVSPSISLYFHVSVTYKARNHPRALRDPCKC